MPSRLSRFAPPETRPTPESKCRRAARCRSWGRRPTGESGSPAHALIPQPASPRPGAAGGQGEPPGAGAAPEAPTKPMEVDEIVLSPDSTGLSVAEDIL